MSIDAVISRIDQIQSLVQSFDAQPASTQQASTATQPATAAATSTGSAATFAQALSQATTAQTSSGSENSLPEAAPFMSDIQAAAKRYGVDPALIQAVIKQESGFNPNAASPAGAVGLMQLMPSTARGLGVTNPNDPAQSIDAGTHYLREQLDQFGGDPRLALAAYNAGPGAVSQYGGVPPYPETQSYVTNVLATFNSLRSST